MKTADQPKDIDIRFPSDRRGEMELRFTKRYDSGGLVRQSLDVEYDEESIFRETHYTYSLERLRDVSSHLGKFLYHVTHRNNIETIRKNGLTPHIGNSYYEHWRGFLCDGSLGSLLEPGIFFLQGKRMCRTRGIPYITCRIRFESLEPDKIFIDSAWKKEQSLFYVGSIAPESIQFMK